MRALAVLAVTSVVASCLVAVWTAKQVEAEMRSDFLARAAFSAQSLQAVELRALRGTADDLSSPAYHQLKAQFRTLQSAASDCRFIYLLGRRTNGQLFIFLDGEPEHSPDYSPPGDVVPETTPGFARVLHYLAPDVVGPYSDRWGTWMTAVIPLSIQREDGIRMAFAMDKDARLWRRTIWRQSIPPAAGLGLFLLLLTGGSACILKRRTAGCAVPRWMNHFEAGLTFAVGLALTAMVTWVLGRAESANRKELLGHWAESRMVNLSQTLNEVVSKELEGLASFFEGSEEVTADEFQHFAGYLTLNQAVRSWAWIAPVPAHQKEAFERKMRQEVSPDFAIWEMDPLGRPVPASPRDVYYPTLYRVSWQDRQRVLGFDGGAEPARRRAMERAMQTGLPSVVLNTRLIMASGQTNGMLVYRPVFHKTPARTLQGLVYAAIHLDHFLNETIRDRMVQVEWRWIPSNAPPQRLAAVPPDFIADPSCASTVWRFCAGGEVFEGVTQAGKSFEQLYPVRAVLYTTAAGLILTLAATAITALVRHWESELEDTVAKRTAALQESEETFRRLFEDSAEPILLLDTEGHCLDCNRAACATLGAEDERRLRGATPMAFSPARQPDGRPSAEVLQECLQKARKEKVLRFEWLGRRFDGTEVFFDTVIFSLNVRGREILHATFRDITDRKRAEEARDRLQAQLLQAQKMESIGRLAGGVAHDFNNMLNVIIGHTELLLEELPPNHSARESLGEIRTAAERSAALTRQLLGFARKQTIAPEVLDLNQSLERTLKMLRRLIGEDIELAFIPGADLWPVKLDPVQLDQVLANLCVNARDAIHGVGRITIETRNARVDEAAAARHADCQPGDYVMIAVCDTGHGMDAETLRRIFEPFFTTKGVGKGTGLGLAMVYGVVQQNRGFIEVESQPGKGSCFRLFFPRHQAAATSAPEASNAPSSPLKGCETVLLVEDEPANRAVTQTMLERLGYKVIPAATPREALRLAESNGHAVDVLLTDVIMPEMNGRELCAQLSARHPRIKCLYMSGYSENVVAERGVLKAGTRLLSKPFTLQELGSQLRAVLDAGPSGAS